jgi:rubrerythrin
MQEDQTSGSDFQSPVDDATYDLLQALTSKLEAIEAYEQYLQDGDQELFNELLNDERRHARLILDSLKERLANS